MANSDTSQLDVRIAFGVGLLPHVPELIEQVGELRALLHADQFIEMPRVRMTDDLQLPPRE